MDLLKTYSKKYPGDDFFNLTLQKYLKAKKKLYFSLASFCIFFVLVVLYGVITDIISKYLRGVIIDELVNGYLYDEGGNKTNYTFHHDNLRSVTGLSGHDGATLETTEYGSFGNEVASTGTSNTLKYTSREEDTIGLYYYRARYYDPEIGRFLTEDPKGFDAGVNFYAYVLNNPINFNDPSGLFSKVIISSITRQNVMILQNMKLSMKK